MRQSHVTPAWIWLVLSAILVLSQLMLPLEFFAGVSAGEPFSLSAWAATTPLIDGRLRPSDPWNVIPAEWDDADKMEFVLSWGVEAHNASFYVKNDYINLYLAFVIEGEDFDFNDRVVFNFDNDHDGNKEIGDDQLWVDMSISFGESYGGCFKDGFFPTPSDSPSWSDDVSSGGDQDGVGAAQFTGASPSEPGNYVVEVAHPLNTVDDNHDFSVGVGGVGVGDTLGVNVLYIESAGSDGWPTFTWGDWSQMATIRIAEPLEPRPPRHLRRNLKIDGIEVTQAVQYFGDLGHIDNSLPLAYGKSTVVRVYVDLGFLVESTAATVYLYATASTGDSLVQPREWGSYGPLTTTVVVPGFLPPSLHRENENYTANFPLPDYWVTRGSLNLVAFVKAAEDVSELSYADNWMSWQTFSFTPTESLEIGYFLIDYRATATGVAPNLPSPSKILNGKQFFEKVVPMPDLSEPLIYYPMAGSPLFWDRSNFTQPCAHEGSPHAWDDNRTAQRLLLHELHEIYEDLIILHGEAPDQIVGLYANALTQTGRVRDIPGTVFIAEEDRPWSFAHEIGHNYGFQHSWSDALNPYFGTERVNSSQVAGFDTQEDWLPKEPGDTVKLPSADDSERNTKYGGLMSYYDEYRWISPYEWQGLMEEFDPPAEALQNSILSGVQSSSPGLRVSGIIYRNNTGGMFPTFQTFSFLNLTPPSGPYTVEFRGSPPAEPLLHSQSFNVSFEPDEECAFFMLNLPLMTGIYSVSLLNSSISPAVLLDKVTVSSSHPQVAITYPNGGETISGSFNVTWTAQDLDGDPLTFKLFYSSDNGSTWSPLSPRITGTSYCVDASVLPGSSQHLLRVQVSDGLRTSEDQSNEAFTIVGKAPINVVGIGVGPCNTYRFGEPAIFKGYAFDPEDGVLQDSSLTWTSDLNGFLGTGRVFATTDLTPGTHNITLTATDSNGNNSTNSFTITVDLRDVAVTDVTLSKTIIGEGYDLSLNVTLENQGLSAEIVNVALSFYEINASSLNFELYGSATEGWGTNPSNMTSPGPTITVNQWDHLQLALHSADALTHNFFVDYNGDGTPSVNEPTSPDFTSTIYYQFTVDTQGTFTYYCHHHGTVMFGTLIVREPDMLSYYQESVPPEEYLASAEKRYSIRRHTCLMKGYFIVATSATPVPNEIQTADNTILVEHIVFVTIPGDFDANRDVDIYDIVLMAGAYGSEEGQPKYKPTYDIDDDGDIDIYDVVIAAGNYGKSW